MSEQIILREYQKADHKVLENVVREAWKYDLFCSPKTAAKMAKVYLNSCLINQTFMTFFIYEYQVEVKNEDSNF